MAISVRYELTLPDGTIEYIIAPSAEDCIQKAFSRGLQWAKEHPEAGSVN